MMVYNMNNRVKQTKFLPKVQKVDIYVQVPEAQGKLSTNP